MTYASIRKLIATTAAAGALALSLGAASASPELVGTTVGKTADEITATLTSMGYEVKKVKTEEGFLEAYARKDGGRYEIYVDTSTGQVAKVKD